MNHIAVRASNIGYTSHSKKQVDPVGLTVKGRVEIFWLHGCRKILPDLDRAPEVESDMACRHTCPESLHYMLLLHITPR